MLSMTQDERNTIAGIAEAEGRLALTEYQYDETVSSLLKMSQVAVKHKNKQLLKAIASTTDAWANYFQATKKYVAKTADKKSPNTKKMTQFIDEQAAFFKVFSKDLNAKIKAIK